MAFQAAYHRETFKPEDAHVPGNSTNSNPVEFDLAPAEGPDLARIRSVIVATAGLVNEQSWSPEMQSAVIGAFETGSGAFVNTVEAIRGLTVPAAMAKRAGLIAELPTRVKEGQSFPTPDHNAPIQITTGVAFSKVCNFPDLCVIALHVAFRIADLSNRSNIDSRFFAQPSGSGGGTPGKTPGSAAGAKTAPEGSATAGKRKRRRASQPAGISQ